MYRYTLCWENKVEAIEEDKNGEDGERGEVRREEKRKGTKQTLSYHFKEEEEEELQDDGEKSSKARGEKRKEDPK